MRLTITKFREQINQVVFPYLRELALFHVADRLIPPELIRVDISEVVDIAHALASSVPTIHGLQTANARRLVGHVLVGPHL